MKTNKTKQPHRGGVPLQPLRVFSKIARAAIVALALALPGAAVAEGKVRAVASIAPLHSLLAGVMGENPVLLVNPGQTPHRVQLSPSQVQSLHDADILFYIGGGGGKGFSPRLLRSIEGKKVAFSETITMLPARKPEFLQRRGGHKHRHKHDHNDDHHNDDHDDDHGRKKHRHKHNHDDDDNHDRDHSHDDDDKHKYGKYKDDHDDDDNHRHRGHRNHRHGRADVHIWLDIDRARQIVKQMADALGEVNPSKRETYAQNAAKMDAKLAALDAEVAATLANAKGKPFAVAHDAYQYFELKYGLTQPVALRGGHAGGLSAKRLRAVRRALGERGINCVFREPQLPARHLIALVEGSDAVVAVADPLGANIPAGEEQYFALIRQLAKSFADCLGR